MLWAVIILALTLTPGKYVPPQELFSYDKIGHAIIFLVLTFLFTSGLFRNNGSVGKSLVIGLGLTVLYGAGIECAQEFIPDRGMEFMDLVANCTGSVAGSLVFVTIRKK